MIGLKRETVKLCEHEKELKNDGCFYEGTGDLQTKFEYETAEKPSNIKAFQKIGFFYYNL